MEIIINNDSVAVGEMIAKRIVELFTAKPNAILGLATGSSPLPTYRAIRRHFEAGNVTFARAEAFTLDEYLGLPHDHPELYRTVIRRELTDHLDFAPGAVHSPDPLAADPHAAAAEYDQAIAAIGGVDLQLLGIGVDGHIGFNEPGSSLVSRTRVEPLMKSTRVANARFFGGDVNAVPTHCITQGLGTVMSAKHLILIAAGASKARAIAGTIEGAVSSRWPASVLQFHPHATVFLDDEAASKLELVDYYREAFGQVPSWRAQ